MTKYVVIALLVVLVIVPIQTHKTAQGGEDSILVQEAAYLNSSHYAAYNITCQGNTGYYGSFQCDEGEVKLSVVETSLLSEFLDGQYITEYEWQNNSLPRWEFPCIDGADYTFIFMVVSDMPTTVTLLIVEDRTPPVVHINCVREALYRPKYEISFSFSGGFFLHARIDLPKSGSREILYSNGSLVWEAFYYNYSRSEYVVLPDGLYNITVQVIETMRRTEDLILVVQKTTDQEVSVFVISLLLAFIASVAVEKLRRIRVQRTCS